MFSECVLLLCFLQYVPELSPSKTGHLKQNLHKENSVGNDTGAFSEGHFFFTKKTEFKMQERAFP